MSAPDPLPGPDAPPPRSALDWPRHAGVGDAVARVVEARVRQRRRRQGRALVATVLLACVGTVAWRLNSPAPVTRIASSSAVVSMPARQVLPDGTVVELNAGAEIAADFTPGLRRVILRRGEAHFDVSKDPRRPFVVVAGQIEVRAIGTAFAVQFGRSAVEVLVTEGRVAVERVQLPEGPSLAILDAGLRTVVDTAAIAAPVVPPPPVLAVPAAEVAERLAWRAPRLEFSATPLREVVAVFNAHSRVRLSLADSTLGDLPLSGIARADNTSALLQLLHTQFGLSAAPQPDGTILLRRE